MRGDLEVNEVKLKDLVGCVTLELATEEQILKTTGGPQGFSGPVGLTGVRLIADPTVMAQTAAATGANVADAHLIGVVPGRDFTPDTVADVRLARAGDPCPRCGGTMEEKRGIEVGHVFKLGTKYSEKMGCGFLDSDGIEHPMIMGCYGLGVGRTAAAAVEQSHDDRGIIWPLPLAPYEVVLVLLNSDQEAVVEAAGEIYERFVDADLDVLFDDRAERPGVKFNDMDLIGFPVRVVVGKRGLAEGTVEISLRKDGEKMMVPIADAIDEVKKLLEELEISVQD